MLPPSNSHFWTLHLFEELTKIQCLPNFSMCTNHPLKWDLVKIQIPEWQVWEEAGQAAFVTNSQEMLMFLLQTTLAAEGGQCPD